MVVKIDQDLLIEIAKQVATELERQEGYYCYQLKDDRSRTYAVKTRDSYGVIAHILFLDVVTYVVDFTSARMEDRKLIYADPDYMEQIKNYLRTCADNADRRSP